MRLVIIVAAIAAAIAGAAWQLELGPFKTANNADQAGSVSPQGAGSGRGGRGRGRGFDRTVVVTTASVELSPPSGRIQSIGTGKAVQSVVVTADVAGTVEEIHFKLNADIQKDAPLVTLKRDTQEVALRSTKAAYEKQRASYERYNQLQSNNSSAVSQAQIDEARAALALAEADLAAAQYEYDRRIIRAPFTGRINLSDLSLGAYLPLGAEVVRLSDATRLLVEFAVPEVSASSLEVGQPVRLSTPAMIGRFFNGKIVAFDSTIDAEARTVNVRADVENSDRAILPGSTFNVTIQRDAAPLPHIPAVSVAWSREGAYVWRLDADKKPERVAVIIRRRSGDRVWVEAELKAGDVVVKDGALKVTEGAPVSVKGERAVLGQIQ